MAGMQKSVHGMLERKHEIGLTMIWLWFGLSLAIGFPWQAGMDSQGKYNFSAKQVFSDKAVHPQGVIVFFWLKLDYNSLT